MTTTLDLTGMHCQMCVKRLTGAFEAVPGVTAARVTLSPPRAEIETSQPVAVETLSSAAREAGAAQEAGDPVRVPGHRAEPAHDRGHAG